MAGRPSLRLKHIEKIDDLLTAIDLCESLEVPDEGLQTLEDYKERLTCHYWANKLGNYKQTVSKAIVEAGEDDQKKRDQLIDFLKQMVRVTMTDTNSSAGRMLGDFLNTEGTSADLKRDCQQRVGDLKNGECILLVAGESSAGKSTVLNLLFDEQILPVHAGSCTATITTVRYGHNVAKIFYKDPGVPPEEIQLDENGKKRFNELVFMQGDAREEGHGIMEIQLYLPLWYLKTGLVLADTPGIGETEFLETYLVDYISKNQILGFIYVIMSDAAGGVTEDRLLLLLKMIIEEQRKRENSLPFDPKAALFVCNRFDAIQEDEREKVKEHILEQLGKFWPEFEPSSAIFFSAKRAQRDVDAHPDYINAQYRALLQGLQKLVCTSMDRRITATYKWIGRLLQRITHFLKSTVKRLDMTERDRKERTEKITYKINCLTSKTTTVVHTLRAEIEEKKIDIVREIKEYLQKPQVKFKLCSAWKEGEIPEVKEKVRNRSHWMWIKERIDAAFYDRLCQLLQDWEDENCDILKIEERVVQDIRLKLGLLEEEISEMEHDMQSETGSVSDEDISPTANRRLSRRLTLSYNAGTSLVDVPKQLPLQVLSRIKTEAPNDPASDNFITQSMTRRNTKAFSKDPRAWAKERAAKLLQKLAQNKSKRKEEGILEELVMQLLQRPVEYLDMVEKRVPSILDANQQLLLSLEKEFLTERQDIAKFETMMKDIENLRKCLKNYGEGYIFVDDFKSNEVKVLQVTKTGESLASTLTRNVRDLITSGSEEYHTNQDLNPRGLWSVVSGGVLKTGDNAKPIAIRFYLPSSGVENTFEEVAKLRCLLHDDIPLAEFLGIHHAEMQLPAFIYRGDLQSVRRFLLHSSSPELVVMPILDETAEAISYIHSKGLVHMELSPSTVTVDENGAVKLTGACMPRRASLPLDIDTAVADFAYLPPEVLNGDLYIAQSDVYGFGLLMYELLTKIVPFQKHRKFAFQYFVNKLNPEEMLFGEIDIALFVSHRALDIMKRCVMPQESDRPHMSDVRMSISEMKGQFRRTSVSFRNDKTASPSALFKTSRRREKESH